MALSSPRLCYWLRTNAGDLSPSASALRLRRRESRRQSPVFCHSFRQIKAKRRLICNTKVNVHQTCQNSSSNLGNWVSLVASREMKSEGLLGSADGYNSIRSISVTL